MADLRFVAWGAKRISRVCRAVKFSKFEILVNLLIIVQGRQIFGRGAWGHTTPMPIAGSATGVFV